MPGQRQKPVKDEPAREREADLIRRQLEDLGFAHDVLGDVYAALDRFATRGEGSTTTHRFPGYGVKVILLLSTQPHVTSYARVTRQ